MTEIAAGRHKIEGIGLCEQVETTTIVTDTVVAFSTDGAITMVYWLFFQDKGEGDR